MKILLVDDEILVLQMLNQMFDWKSMGIHSVITAENGIEAQKIITKELPEILITDIKMPKMDGIKLIEWVKKNKANTKIIILSAYGEFEYAQKALSMGVTGYVLKPIKKEEFLELVFKAIVEIENEQKRNRSYSISKELAENRILTRLLYPKGKNDVLFNALEELDIGIHFEKYQLMSINVDNDTYDEYIRFDDIKNKNITEFDNIISECVSEISENTRVFENNQGEWIVLIDRSDASSPDMLINSNDNFGTKVFSKLKEKLNLNLFIAISGIHNDMNEFSVAYSEILDIVKFRFFLGDSDVIAVSDLRKDYSLDEIKELEHEKLLISFIKEGQKDKAIEAVDTIINIIGEDVSINPKKIYCFFYELLFLLRQELLKENINEEALGDLKNISVETLMQFRTLGSLQVYLKKIINDITEITIKSHKKKNNKQIMGAIEYISANYNTNITLDGICDYVALSKNYFSYIFKREIGMGIWDYLTNLRIEKAKELFEDINLKTYEVSYSVGYENPSHFAKMFKKYTGMTPQEYRSIR